MAGVRQYLQGYVEIGVTGYGIERFLNLCMHKEMTIWDLKQSEGQMSMYISLHDFKQLQPILRKTKCRLHIIKKCGLPFFFYEHRKQKSFVMGLLLCFLLVYIMSLFVWDIHVTGSTYYTEDEIVKFLEQEYVTLGTKKSEISCHDMETKLMEQFDEIAWISCELRGTQLLINLTETIVNEPVVMSDRPSDIVAAKDSEIISIITRNGTPVAKVNESVKKGDVLISGIIHIYNDSDEIMETDYVAADGDVFGVVSYAYEDSFDLSYYEKEYTENRKQGIAVGFLNKEYLLFKPKIDYVNYDATSNTYMNQLGDTFYLPFYVKRNLYREYTPVRKQYDEKSAMKKAKERLLKKLTGLQEKGVEIMENNVTIEVLENQCVASGTIIVKERIGIPRDLVKQETTTESQD